MPAVGAHSAAVTSPESAGSSSRARSPVIISSPGTPFARPRSMRLFSSRSSSSPKAMTNEPTRSSGTFSVSHMSSNISLPRTLRRAISVPGTQS